MDTMIRITAAAIIIAVAGWGHLPAPVGTITAAEANQRAPVGRFGIDDSSRFVFYGGTRAQRDRMTSDIDRYGNLGLELPRLEITFAEDCRERFGAWGRMQSDIVPWRIEVCSTAVYSHELAHAWDRWILTDVDRNMYLEIRDLEAWQGSDIPWEDRGQEDLASLVARVVGQGIDNYHSEDRMTDLHDFGRITGVEVPTVELVDTTDSRFESPQY